MANFILNVFPNVLSKKQLEIFLSKLKGFTDPEVKLEQYITPSDIASEILWFAYMQGDIKDKVVADLGAGTGVFGIGALILGAKEVYFVEVDRKAIEVLVENLSNLNFQNYKIFNIDVSKFDVKVNTVIMNPPFGVKVRHADIKFVKKACEISKVIYSIHKAETFEFIKKYYKKLGFKVTHYKFFKFPIRHTYSFHEKPKVYIEAFWLRSEKFINHN